MLEKMRQKKILDILDEKQFASVRFMADQLESSEATIRRDITKMAESNLLIKIRGGVEAIKKSGMAHSKPHLKGSVFLEDVGKQVQAKRQIAKKAVELCEEGESIIINGGSSTYMMSEFLGGKDLSILTNSFVLAQELLINSENQVTLPGGELYREQGIVLSAYENDTIQYYHATKMFMGTPGICSYGVMESDPLLIRAEQKLRKRADKLIVLADHSKIGTRSNFVFSTLNEVDILITDNEADEAILKTFEEEGVQIILADDQD